jgi:hypothetical protein
MMVACSPSDRTSEAREYHRLNREIERLLAEDRLAQARRLNDRARTLFRRLYGSRVRKPETGGDRVCDDADDQ